MKQIKIGTATLIHGDCEEFMKDLPDKSFDLIIVDPPYYETKGEFDFIWKSFDDYLSDVEIWANELKRISKDSASLFWWGNSKKIAYTQIILDKYFNLENSMIWEKRIRYSISIIQQILRGVLILIMNASCITRVKKELQDVSL